MISIIDLKRKSTDELNSLNTKRLLAYYKSVRGKVRGGTRCECCGEFEWDISPKRYAKQKQDYEEGEIYLTKIKNILDNRENVK